MVMSCLPGFHPHKKAPANAGAGVIKLIVLSETDGESDGAEGFALHTTVGIGVRVAKYIGGGAGNAVSVSAVSGVEVQRKTGAAFTVKLHPETSGSGRSAIGFDTVAAHKRIDRMGCITGFDKIIRSNALAQNIA